MEFINRIELTGVVGRIYRQTVSDQVMANFSLVTEHCFRDKAGCSVIETTWHNVVAWNSDNVSGLDAIDRGSRVHVIGRLRTRRYVDANGESRTSYDVAASTVDVLTVKETL